MKRMEQMGTVLPDSSSSSPKAKFAAELTDRQRELIDKLVVRTVELRMTAPAILFLESVRPLNYVGSQVMVFFAPIVRGFFGLPEWDEIRLVLERRESIGYFLDLLEDKEGEFLEKEQQIKQMKRMERKEKKQKGTGRRWWWPF